MQKNFRFSCMHEHSHVIFADTTAVFMVWLDQTLHGFANKITKIIRTWSKQSIKQFLKSKSAIKNIYCIVVFFQVL